MIGVALFSLVLRVGSKLHAEMNAEFAEGKAWKGTRRKAETGIEHGWTGWTG
jgi:hypothetical protein